MKKVISILLICVLAMSLFVGCSAEKAIIGSWSYQQKTILNVVTERTYTFKADGTGSAPALEGTVNVDMTYTLDGDTLTINRGELLDSIAGTQVYTVKIVGKTMTLTDADGNVIELTKAE